ncbi:xylose isomerase-like protein [Microdochium bolleyi]|uniref:Xylose isomerase-like protein n=1 Tax=Microdochium bolleyi TaxID=196109 RepID=A0A136IPP9_9PEZI|nr:xylose isomerase-like protein [Microdochium bolleyi]
MASRPGICSISLGRVAAGHTLERRLDMAQIHGFRGIELFHEDLVSVAEETHNASFAGNKLPQPFTSTGAQEIAAAHKIRIMCAERDLTIICLQPFWQYEGLLDRAAHFHNLTVKLPHWLNLAHALGTDMIQVPSNFLPADQLSEDFNLAVADLRRMADAGLAFAGLDSTGKPLPITTTTKDHGLDNHGVIRFAYESLAWGTRCDTWEDAWRTVQAVNRSNFGLLLDTFHLAGSRTFADPASRSGLVPDAHTKLRESLARLVREVDVKKIFYVQIASAEKLAEPLVLGHELYQADQPARMSWSRSCRLFYGEEGEYLPLFDVAHAIFQDLGFRGWVSHEVFTRRAWDQDEDVPLDLAGRAAYSWMKIAAAFRLQHPPPAPPPTRVSSPDSITEAGKMEKERGETSMTAVAATDEDVVVSGVETLALGGHNSEDGQKAFL